MTTETRSLYSQLPAIDRLLRDSSFLSLRDTYGHTRVVELLRQMLDEAREVIRDSQTLPAWCENWAQEVDARLTKEAQSALRPVINLTGTVLHTNLGRALQAEAAVEAVAQAMRSPVTLEYDLDDAGRGHRDRALAQLLCRITGAEDACIVNNNAAAVLLMLAILPAGKRWWYLAANWWRLAARFVFLMSCVRQAAPYTKWGPPTARTLMIIVRR